MSSFLKKYRTLIVSLSLGLLSLHLALTADKKEAGRGVLVREIMSALADPLSEGVLTAVHAATGVAEDYIVLVNTKAENDALRKDLEALRAENARLKEEVNLDKRLKEIAGYTEGVPFNTITASIIAFNAYSGAQTITLDKGRASGVMKDMAVITPTGAIGRILDSTLHSSRVLLSTDPRSDIDVILSRSRVKGVVEGAGTDVLLLKYVRLPDDVSLGDGVITSGLAGTFPKGIPVGTVTKIEKGTDNFFKSIEVMPSVPINRRLEEVLVVVTVAQGSDR